MRCILKHTLMFSPLTLRQNQVHANLQGRLKADTVLAEAAPSPNQHSEDQASHVSMFLSSSPPTPAHEDNPSPHTVSLRPGDHMHLSTVVSVQSEFRFPTFAACHKENSERQRHLAGLKLKKRPSGGAIQPPVRVGKVREPLLCACCHRCGLSS